MVGVPLVCDAGGKLRCLVGDKVFSLHLHCLVISEAGNFTRFHGVIHTPGHEEVKHDSNTKRKKKKKKSSLHIVMRT